jgi:hypothetical protein
MNVMTTAELGDGWGGGERVQCEEGQRSMTGGHEGQLLHTQGQVVMTALLAHMMDRDVSCPPNRATEGCY